LGIDPNQEYVRLASGRAAAGARFEQMAIGSPGGMKSIPSHSMDLVFMSDALLFYFVPPQKGEPPSLEELFSEIRRALKPDGRFVSLEPHSVFWLLPWLGQEDHPFTVVTEYRRRSYRVTPTLSDLIQAFARGGFCVHWMEELYADPSYRALDERGFHFSDRFPLWHLFELRPADDKHHA
jgi:SAM-dependent methyltransferase